MLGKSHASNEELEKAIAQALKDIDYYASVIWEQKKRIDDLEKKSNDTSISERFEKLEQTRLATYEATKKMVDKTLSELHTEIDVIGESLAGLKAHYNEYVLPGLERALAEKEGTKEESYEDTQYTHGNRQKNAVE